MKIGTNERTKVSKRLAPPRPEEIKKEKTTMSNENTTTTTTTKKAGSLPRHLKYASVLRRRASQLTNRTSKKGQIKKMRLWIDEAAEVVEDGDKSTLADVGRLVDNAAKSLQAAADLLDELPESITLRRGRTGGPGLVAGGTAAIVEKKVAKYKDLLGGQVTGLHVVGFRKTHAVIQFLGEDGAERLVIPRVDLVPEGADEDEDEEEGDDIDEEEE